MTKDKLHTFLNEVRKQAKIVILLCSISYILIKNESLLIINAFLILKKHLFYNTFIKFNFAQSKNGLTTHFMSKIP